MECLRRDGGNREAQGHEGRHLTLFCFLPDCTKAEAGPRPLPGDVGPVERTWRNAEVLPSDLGQRNWIFCSPSSKKKQKENQKERDLGKKTSFSLLSA